MTDPYKKTYRYFELISIGTSALITKAITDWLEGLRVQQVIVLSITFALVYLLNEILMGVFKNIFINIVILRKYLLEKQFIEGMWIEFLTDNNKLESVGIVLIEVCKEGEGLKISGDNYKYNSPDDFVFNYSFYSKDELTRLNFPILDFAYVNRLSQSVNGRSSIEGVAQLTFGSIQHKPSRYYASFNLAEDDPKKVGLEGWKIKDKNDFNEVQLESIDKFSTRKIMQKYVKLREKNQSQNPNNYES